MLYVRLNHTILDSAYEFFAKQMERIEFFWFEKWDGKWNIETYHTTEHFTSYIENADVYIELALDDNYNIIGYIEARKSKKDSKTIHIWWILVDELEHWKWIGKNLMKRLEVFAKENNFIRISSEILKKNLVSIKLHEKLDYIQAWTSKHSEWEIEFVKIIW